MPRQRYKHPRRFKSKRPLLKKLFRSRVFWFGFVAVCVFGAAGYWLFFTPWLQIQTIEIRGNQQVERAALEREVRAHVPRSIAFFATTHFLLVDSLAVTKGIEAAFPEIESATVKKKFPRTLEIVVEERKGIAVWCQQKALRVEFPNGDEGNERLLRECFALDKHGIAFEAQEPEREMIISGEGIEVALGDRAVARDALSGMLEFQQAFDSSALFQEVGLRVSSLHIVSRERVHANTSEGWGIYFNPAQELQWQITKGKLVLKQEIPFQRRPFLEYIDLRFGDQAYIKYR